MKIPAGVLFRSGKDWAVFAARNGRAKKQTVEVGHRTPGEADIIRGLQKGDWGISHPSNQIEEGVRIKEKQ